MKKGPFIALLVVILIILGLLIVGGVLYLQFTSEPYVADQTYLKIELRGPIAETSPSGIQGLFSDSLSIRDLWYQIARAKVDRRIKGIIVKISDIETGFAKIEQIGRFFKDFEKSKKPVVAFIEEGGLREYYLASFADKVIAFRGGMLTITGVAAEAVFLKNTLSKLGIQAEMFHIGEYKTAANQFTEDHMTPPHRESMEVLLNDIYSAVIEGIARNRHLDRQLVRQKLEESPLPMNMYLQDNFLDAIGYEDEVYAQLKNRFPQVSFRTYAKTTSPNPFVGAQKIAVIFASGQIMPGKSGGQSVFGDDVLGSDSLAEQLRSARNNYSVRAVVLRIDSPGGSAVASDVILREAELLAKKKPLVISMSDLAASGGYWITLSSSKTMALPETITGSIGVLSGKFVMKGLYDKLGITKELVKTTKYSGMFSDYHPFSDDEKGKIMAEMETIYSEFLKKVALNRKKTVAEIDKIARGRVWSGDSALRLNLIDQIGGLSDAILEARKLARIPDSEGFGVRIYPQKKTLWDFIFDLGGVRVQNPLDVKAQIAMLKKFYPALMMPFAVHFD